ncbi:MAG: hypothetical protein M3066_19415 [Actinomycetota bacterium]|nr:hypothetical protein [Actinomycetota bacterium]
MAAFGLVAVACGSNKVDGIRASASVQVATTTTTTAPPDTTTSSTEVSTTTTSSTVRPSTTTTKPAATTSTTARTTTTVRPPPTTPTTRFPGDTRRAVAFDHYAVSADGLALTITYFSGPPPCSLDDGLSVAESAASVRVTIFERDGSNGQPCPAIAQQKTTTVSLASPLGARMVIDGARS